MGMSIKEILNLSVEEQVRLIEKGDITDAVIMAYDLSTAQTNLQVEIAGNFFGMIFGTDSNVNVDVNFNKVDPNSSNSLNFTQGLYMHRPFGRVFLTWTAQSSKVAKFIVSTYSSETFGVQDQRSNTSIATTLSSILTANQAMQTSLASIKSQLVGPITAGTEAADVTTGAAASVLAANTAPTAVILHADFANTDYIYIGFSSSVSATRKAFALKAGMTYQIDNYKGVVYAYSASSQKLSVSYY